MRFLSYPVNQNNLINTNMSYLQSMITFSEFLEEAKKEKKNKDVLHSKKKIGRAHVWTPVTL